jgi:transposase
VRKARRYPPEFRQEAVELYRTSDRSLEQIASELGISPTTLHRWHDRTKVDEKERDTLSSDERTELRRLRRENRRLKEEREILKKAAAFFVRESETR